jgi:hypothetical protein
MKAAIGVLPVAFERAKQELPGLAVPLAIILIAIVSSPNPGTIALFGYSLPVLCPFRAFTGLDCPGCGITRALVLAFHGHWKESFLMHIWGIPFAGLLITAVIVRSISIAKLLFSEQTLTIARPFFSPHIRSWISQFVMLSLLVPWAIKTLALLYILYF